MPTSRVFFRFDRGRGVGIELQDISVVTGSEFVSKRRIEDSGTCGRVSIWQIELLPTVEADLVCAVFDREHATHVPVPAAKEELNNLQKQFHTS